MDLKRQIAKCGSDNLAGYGFRQASAWALERPLEHLCQGIGFVPGVSSRAGLFTIDVYWRYTIGPLVDPGAMDCRRRLREFSDGETGWFSANDESSFSKVIQIVVTQAIPFLNKYSTVQDILEAMEVGAYDPSVLFGADKGWQEYNIGNCYLVSQDYARAIACMRRVIDHYSGSDYPWVQSRRKAAEHQLRVAILST